MSARSKARKRALDVLYAADARSQPPLEVLSERIDAQEATPLGEYAEILVRGYADNADEIDDLLAQYALGWTLDRMPAVDRAILRIAVFELVFMPDVPAAVAIDEAVELAKMLSTDNSPRFINGVLGQIQTVVSRASNL